MAYKYCCVVDTQGYYDNNFVLVTSEVGDFSDALIQSYVLQDGERLIDANSPAGAFARPRWNGSEWIEGGTAEEIAAWEAAKPVPEPAVPGELDILREEVDAALMELAGGLAEQEAVNQEQDNAIMEIGGMIGG